MAEKKSSFFGLGVVFGSILGALAATFLAPKSGKKNRDLLARKIRQLENFVKEGKFDDKIKEIFGEVTAETKETYFKVKKAVTEKVDELAAKLSKVDNEKYGELVSEIVDSFKNDFKHTEKVAEKFKTQLVADWKKITKK